MSVEFNMYVELWSWIYEGNIVVSCRQVTSITPTHLKPSFYIYKSHSNRFPIFNVHFILIILLSLFFEN
jgi:hypothetical protein